MFFTQYSPVLFLTTMAITMFVVFNLLYTRRENKRGTAAVCLTLVCLAVIGLIKYLMVTRPLSTESMPLFLSLAQSCFILTVFIYFLQLRWPDRLLAVNIMQYLYLIGAGFVAAITVLFYPGHLSGLTYFFQASPIIFFLSVPVLINRDHFARLPLLTKLIVYLATYTALSNLAIILLSSWINEALQWKLDILVYSSIFWFVTIQYLKPIQLGETVARYSAPEALGTAIVEECLLRLKMAFEDDKLYLDPELNLQSLSSAIRISSRTISAVLNHTVQKNFHEYLNYYRVEEAKKLLLNYRERNTTIAAVAYEAGFNSLATFQRVFKKISGETPREFAEN